MKDEMKMPHFHFSTKEYNIGVSNIEVSSISASEQPTLLHLRHKVGGRRDSSILMWWEPMGVTLMTLWRKWLSTSSMSSPPKLSTTSLINKLLDLIWFSLLFLLSSLKAKQKATGFFLLKKIVSTEFFKYW